MKVGRRRVQRPWLGVTALLACTCVLAQPTRVETGVELHAGGATGSVNGGAGSERVDTTVKGGAEPQVTDASRPRLAGISAELTSGLLFDDNIYRTDTDEQRDVVVVVQPRLYLDAQMGRHDLRIGYEGDIGRYQDQASENYWDHAFISGLGLDLGRKLKARVDAGLEYGSDRRGDLTSRPFAGQEPDRWREHFIEGQVTVGRRIARAQIRTLYGVRGRRYQTNGQQFRDLDERNVVVTGYYNLGPRFSIVSEVAGRWVDYLDPSSTLDSRDQAILAGVAWEATAKTRGEVKVGVRRLDFDDPGRSSIDGSTWDARVTWAPKTYSQFTAYTSRDVTEGAFGPEGFSGATVVDVYGLRWRHGFTDRLTLDAAAERAVSSFYQAGDDEYMHYEAGLRFRVNRWVDLFGIWDLSTRSSDVPGGDYEATGIFVGFDLRLDHRPGR